MPDGRIQHTVFWRALAWTGMERSTLTTFGDGRKLLGGTVIGVAGGGPFEARYHVACDIDWLTQHADVKVETRDAPSRSILLEVDQDQHWRLNGELIARVSGCADVDLGFSPATNTLPIQRISLDVGQRADVVATWLKFPELIVEPLQQRYTRLAETAYRYESASGFVARIEVDAFGIVTSYEGGWERL